jgi:hypothetical protein
VYATPLRKVTSADAYLQSACSRAGSKGLRQPIGGAPGGSGTEETQSHREGGLGSGMSADFDLISDRPAGDHQAGGRTPRTARQ